MEQNIAIYGAGAYGRYACRLFSRSNGVKVAAVYDSNEKKWGKEFGTLTITSPQKIKAGHLDGIFIAICDADGADAVENFLLSVSDVRIYRNISELVPETIYWDVSGFCNARCRYCVTGRNNRRNMNKNPVCINLENFIKCYNHLYKTGLISKETHLGLFNWNEPFLNREIMDIMAFCSRVDQRFMLSTNASVFRKATDKDTYRRCESILFSMPGFSQDSYDRIHGFHFEQIKENIVHFKEDMLAHGFEGRFIVAAHKYRFSEKELPCLEEWADKNGFEVNAYFPYLAGNSLVVQYLEKELTDDEMDEIHQDLFFNWKMEGEDLGNFMNPICDQMTIDECGKFTLCCAADPDVEDYAVWGDILDINSYEDYRRLKRRMLEGESCKQCSKYHIAYNILNNGR